MSYPAGLSSSSEGGSFSSNARPNDTVADRSREARYNKPPASLAAAKETSKAVKDAILSFQVPDNHRRFPSSKSLLFEWGVGYEKDADKMSAQVKAIWSTLKVKPQRWACLANSESRKK